VSHEDDEKLAAVQRRAEEFLARTAVLVAQTRALIQMTDDLIHDSRERHEEERLTARLSSFQRDSGEAEAEAMESNEQQVQMAREIREQLRLGDPLVDVIRKLVQRSNVQLPSLVSAIVLTTGITRMSAMGIVDAVLNDGEEDVSSS